MSADEVLGEDSALQERPRGGGRHAAPKKPLFTRLHMPAGKAIAMAAMPTAVLMGMGFTPTLAVADDQPTSNSQLADDYKDCLTALEDASASPSASPSPSASESADDSESDAKGDASDSGSEKSGGAKNPSGSKGSTGSGSSGGSSSDSGSDDGAEPAPSPSASAQEPSSGETATASPAPAETEKTDKNVLETIGDAVVDIFDGGGIGGSDKTAEASPSPSASPSAADSGSSEAKSGTSSTSGSGKSSADKSGSGTAKDTSDAVTDTVKETEQKAGDKAEETEKETEEAASDAKDDTDASPSASPSPSASATTNLEDCAVAKDADENGVDNKVLLADDPWYLNASSLLLKGADYQGIVEVKTANGTKKKVLKYVIGDGTDIGDLHQTVNDKKNGVTYHVQAGSGTTSTITDGDTIMYTESISGNLFGLIPVTFDPEHPPPLNIPLIYFTKVKVVQAGQFGGTLHVPGMQVYTSKFTG